MFDAVDWRMVFVPETPLLEIFVRGTLTYLGALLLLRVLIRRQSGQMSLTDLLVVVLIADAAQNAMSDDYRTVPDGLLLVAVIVAWSYAVDWLGYRMRFFEWLIHPPPLPLVKDGKLLRRNMRRELVTMEELMSQLREQGVQDLAQVKTALMEGDGAISVITREDSRKRAPRRRPL